MKLSIWQQFSSNHSNSFTVVGKFKTVEEAQKAEQEFHTIIKAIKEAHVRAGENVSDRERTMGNYYGFEWTKHLDWADNTYQAVAFDNYVMVSDMFVQTWLGAMFVDLIMERLGGEIFVEEEMGMQGIQVELTCEVNTKQQEKTVLQALDPYFSSQRAETAEFVNPPWHEITKRLFDYDNLKMDDDIYYGHVNTKGKTLQFTKMKFSAIGYGLPALIEYLRQAGCTNIQYTLAQRAYNEIYEEDN